MFVDGKSYRLSELGGGVSQFIVVLGNAATHSPRPSYILIDEPELNLHPALQLDFLTTLGSYSTEGVVFATHSVGLARTIGQSIYSFQKEAAGHSVVRTFEATPSLSEFVGALSFSGQPELGFDRILLVESRTDAPAIQQFLRLYGKEHLVLLLPLAGDTLINGKPATEVQLQELKRITDKLFTVIDSERGVAGAPIATNRQDFINLCAKVGIAYHVLDRRALENYFTQAAIDKAFAPAGRFKALGAYDTPPAWNKNDNWRIAREMTEAELDATDLGAFLKGV